MRLCLTAVMALRTVNNTDWTYIALWMALCWWIQSSKTINSTVRELYGRGGDRVRGRAGHTSLHHLHYYMTRRSLLCIISKPSPWIVLANWIIDTLDEHQTLQNHERRYSENIRPPPTQGKRWRGSPAAVKYINKKRGMTRKGRVEWSGRKNTRR